MQIYTVFEPNIPDHLFGGLGGTFMLRICAVNRARRCAWAEQFLELAGMTTVLFCPDNPILN